MYRKEKTSEPYQTKRIWFCLVCSGVLLCWGLVVGVWVVVGVLGTACPQAPPCLGTARPQSPLSILSGLQGTSGSLASPVSDAVCGLRGPFRHGPYAVRASDAPSCLGTVVCLGFFGLLILSCTRVNPLGFSSGTKYFNHKVRDTVLLCPFLRLKTYSPPIILPNSDWMRSASLGCSKLRRRGRPNPCRCVRTAGTDLI